MTSLRKVELKEIEVAAREWAAYEGPLRNKLKRAKSAFHVRSRCTKLVAISPFHR